MRAYGIYLVLGAGLVLIAFGDQLVEGFTRVLDYSLFGAVTSGVVSFLLAVLLGAGRQILNTLLETAYPLQTTEGTVYLGDVPGQFWFSPVVRAVSWLVVGILSLWAAGIFAASELLVVSLSLASGFLLSCSLDGFFRCCFAA